MESQPERPSPTLDDCLKLLRGERDEQRLAGLLLVTKFCNPNDLAVLRRIYDAVGVRFLDRLIQTGAGKGNLTSGAGDNRDVYLQLSITVIAAFCRVPDIAASQDMVSKIPLVLEISSKQSSSSSILEECYEFLFLVSSASEDGFRAWYESGGLKVLAVHMPIFSDGSQQIQLGMKFVELLLSKLSLDAVCSGYLSELSLIVISIARQFAVLHDAVKFEALHILSVILSSKHLEPLHNALRPLPDDNWPNHMRDGIVAILQNRVVPNEKLHALILAESMISILGEKWLLGRINLPNVKEPIPNDRCLLLVLEQSRIEVAVLLNELAYLKYGESNSSASVDEAVNVKQRTVATCFSLVEKIIKLISNSEENEGDLIDDSTSTKVIKGLNETVGIVLEYLQEAKEHGQRKGDDLLASVRVIGSYLAEAPHACTEKVKELLGYMLSVESAEKPSPFDAVLFLLPMMCQLTMAIEGCKTLEYSGGFNTVIHCLVNLVGPDSCVAEDNGCIFLACDTILNVLLKKDQIRLSLDDSTVASLLKALAHWTEDTDDLSVLMMSSSICSLLLDFTSENALLNHSEFDQSGLASLSRLFARSLASSGKDTSSGGEENMDLLEIVTAGYARWSPRFPRVRAAVESR